MRYHFKSARPEAYTRVTERSWIVTRTVHKCPTYLMSEVLPPGVGSTDTSGDLQLALGPGDYSESYSATGPLRVPFPCRIETDRRSTVDLLPRGLDTNPWSQKGGQGASQLAFSGNIGTHLGPVLGARRRQTPRSSARHGGVRRRGPLPRGPTRRPRQHATTPGRPAVRHRVTRSPSAAR